MARKCRVLSPPIEREMQGDKIYRVGIYTRLSVSDNSGGDSIENQKQLIAQYIKGKPDLSLYDIYTDNGITGTRFDRPDLLRLISDCECGRIDCVIVKDLSRLGRSLIETGELIERFFPLNGIRFISVNDNYDSSISNADILIAVKNLMNEMYAIDISKKVRSVLDAKRRRGEYLATYAPYGYMKHPDDSRKLIVDPIAAPIVRSIFSWTVEGLSGTEIARKLNGSDVPSPAKYKLIRGITKTAKYADALWGARTLMHMLSHIAYIGHTAQRTRTKSIVGGGYVRQSKENWIIAENTHEPIIEIDVFNEVQRILENRNAEFYPNKKAENPRETENILHKLVFCGECNRAMTRRRKIRSRKTMPDKLYYYYECSHKRAVPKDNCSPRTVQEGVLLSIIYSTLQRQIALALDASRLTQEIMTSAHYRNAERSIAEQIAETKRECDRKKMLKSEAISDLIDNLLSIDEFTHIKNQYEGEIILLESKLNSLQAQQARYNTAYGRGISVFDAFMSNKGMTREMVSSLIEKIIVRSSNDIEIILRYKNIFGEL